MFAPAIILLVAGAVDLFAVQSSRNRLQDVADSAALAGATQLGLAVDQRAAIARSRASVDGQIAEWADAPTINAEISISMREQQRILQVDLQARRASFFGDILPPGGWRFNSKASATSVGLVPLCVLVTAKTGASRLDVNGRARIIAPACMVHSNRDIVVDDGMISAAMTQAVSEATGPIDPAPGTGAAPIADPLAGLPLQPYGPCLRTQDIVVRTGTYRLKAGIHCNDVRVINDAKVILRPGEHWFVNSRLEATDRAKIRDDDVALIFDPASDFSFSGRSSVDLEGRRTGPLAGIALAVTRDHRRTVTISSDNVDNLLGVIYLQNANLLVRGSGDVARDSDWTVIVARSLQLRGSSSLMINANYNGSSVPVPKGVGPRDGGAALVE